MIYQHHNYSYTDSIYPNQNLSYTIGTDFCLEDINSFPQLQSVSVHCLLANDPIPQPQFKFNVTNLALNGSRLLLEENTESLFLNATVLSPLFENDTNAIRVTCQVYNSIGSSEMITNITVCGKCLHTC